MKEHAKSANSRRRELVLGGLATLAGIGSALAHDEHRHSAVDPGVKRSEAVYKIPPVELVSQDGASVRFPEELDDGRPVVVLDFIYTSCTSVCPMTSAVFSQLQALLGEDLKKTKLVSISIDPEYDTPPRLRDYAKKFSALPQWRHYTGTREASLAVQKAFHAYRGDKMNHFPVTFLRGAPRRPWIRLEGFATPDVLAREYREAVRNA
jgi:protein SCO1/2